MTKEKIAFIVVRYGKDINGGAEYHCRMLAERLVNDYDVEVLTTCVKNYVTGDNEYPEGEEILNGVLVRRFYSDPVEPDLELCQAGGSGKEVEALLVQMSSFEAFVLCETDLAL